MPPTLSIITPSYNQAAYLEQTLRSVITQREHVHEYFVYDAASTDNSPDVIRRYADRIDYWVSEKDNGQADAIHRGLSRATGEYVAWINSDDVYLPGALAAVRAALTKHPDWDVVSGWHARIDGDSRVTSVHRIPGESRAAARWGVFHPNQPTVFFRRTLYEKVGGFNPDLHLVLDTELWYRMLDAGAVWGHVPAYLAAFRRHGESKGVGTPQKWAGEYDFLDRHYPQYHARTPKHYLGRAAAKGWQILTGRELAARRDTARLRGKLVEEAFGPSITTPTEPVDNRNSTTPATGG
jgi:glycosyltransferase involved in cell wall biosynthesis